MSLHRGYPAVLVLLLASPLAKAQNVDLSAIGTRGFAITGAYASQGSGASVAVLGDFNGDGRADVIVGNSQAGDAAAGRADIVFGRSATSALDVAALGSAGLTLLGAGTNDHAGRAVAAAGDINGDGLADALVAAPDADPSALGEAGTVYVVFGSADPPASLALGSLGSAGFAIHGAAAANRIGNAVAAAGDVNDDGFDDLLIGASAANKGYVVFGSAVTSDVSLAALGVRGISLGTTQLGAELGFAVAGAGDVNGDGVDDLLIGAPGASPSGRISAGSAYVVFGSSGLADVALDTLGAGGFAIHGATEFDRAGAGLAGPGDGNGDGRADLAVGAPLAAPAVGRDEAGQVCMVAGKADTGSVDLAAIGASGFCINGAVAGDELGNSLAGAGDLNADGLADLVLGAREANARSGAGYVVYGDVAPDTVELGSLSTEGFSIAPSGSFAGSGLGVGGGGDINGDGLMDLIIGSPFANADSFGARGAAHVVFGVRSFTAVNAPPDLASGDLLGSTIAADGLLFAVGIPGGGPSGAGQVAIYRREGSEVVLEQVLDAPAGMEGLFGGALDLQGDLLLIGGGDVAPPPAKAVSRRKARLLRRNSGTRQWELERELESPLAEDNRFGQSVALAGDTVLIGAPLADNGDGRVYTTAVSENVTQPTTSITPPTGAAGQFGAGMGGTRTGFFAIGSAAVAFGDQNTVALTTGSSASSLWTQSAQAVVGVPAPQVNRIDVDMDGPQAALATNTAVMGMEHELAMQIISNIHAKGTSADLFGGGIAVADGIIAFGSPAAAGGGIVYTTDYRLNLTGTLPAPSGYAGFGQAVALTGGGSLLVGAPASSNDSGAVLTRINLQYVFKQGFE